MLAALLVPGERFLARQVAAQGGSPASLRGRLMREAKTKAAHEGAAPDTGMRTGYFKGSEAGMK
jgi:hypothetical protein